MVMHQQMSNFYHTVSIEGRLGLQWHLAQTETKASIPPQKYPMLLFPPPCTALVSPQPWARYRGVLQVVDSQYHKAP